MDSESRSHPQTRRTSSYDLSRIPKLLLLGYSLWDPQKRYKEQRNWGRMYSVLMLKIENITIVSGLLLASSCNLLVANNGDLRRMTHAAVAASIFGSTLSIVCGLFCRMSITPDRLEALVKQPWLFYYLCSSPSLWGGGSALTFFVAVCAFTWLEESTAKYGWEARTVAVLLSGLLIVNAILCFVVGTWVPDPGAQADGASEHAEEDQARYEAIENENVDATTVEDGLEQRITRSRTETADFSPSNLDHAMFGISPFGMDERRMNSGESNSFAPRDPKRAATVDSAGGAIFPQRVLLRSQSAW